jgi:general secretion pathway protein F
LELVLLRLADILERQVRLTHKIRSALAYPIIMIIVGAAVVVFLMMFIVPKITEMFTLRGQALPWVTELLIDITSFLTSYWLFIAIGAGVAVALWRIWVRRPEGRLAWDKLKLRMPLIGDLYIKVISARFARTLGSMLESGLTMMTALDVVKTVVRNRLVEDRMDDVKSDVRRGKDLAAPLSAAAVFPPMLINMIELGQRSGELEAMLVKVADTYDEEVTMTVDALVSLLEPVMILVMAVVVGFLVIAILLPGFQMSSGFQ